MAGERERWEYRMLPERLANQIDALGAEGWELVAPMMTAHGSVLYLRRRGPDFRERVTLEQKRRYYAQLGVQPGGEASS